MNAHTVGTVLGYIGSVLLLTSPTLASTHVVDASGSPGSQFTDIGSAVVASVPGDIVVVRGGTYSPFVVDRGITVVGGNDVLIVGDVTIIGIPLAERAALVGFSLQKLTVDSCLGPVIVQDIVPSAGTVCVQSDDVRVRNINALTAQGTNCSGMRASASRVEIVDSIFRGAPNVPYAPAMPNGWEGMRLEAGARAHALASYFVASQGTEISVQSAYGPRGGDGIGVYGSFLRLVGSAANGAAGGINWFYSTCDYDGLPGYALAASSSGVYASACAWYTPPTYLQGLHCFVLLGTQLFIGSGPQLVSPNDPLLRVIGTPTAGQLVTFETDAPPGSTLSLAFGRSCRLVDTPPTYVEDLTSRERVFSLGVVPATGKVSFPFVIPSYLPKGFILVTQADVVLPSGELRRTNSAPVVVR